MTHKIKKIFIIAGEPSGDIHAANLVKAIKKESPNINFIGTGGDKMKMEGVNILTHIDQLSVMGFVEVLKHLPRILIIMNKTIRQIKEINPDKIILVDYPGFNLRLSKKIKHLNIPVIYFILPQLWAWKENRINIMKKTLNKSISIFPFEAEWYNSKGLKTIYEGHPLIEKKSKNQKNDFFIKHGLNPKNPVLILLPGSRQQEVYYHWPEFLKVCDMLKRKISDLQIIVAKSNNVTITPMPSYMKIEKDSNWAIENGTAGICSSGTATLECALKKLPTVVCYKMSKINWFLFNYFGKVKYISIVNLIADKEIIPELTQKNMTAEKIIEKLIPYFNIASENRNNTIDSYKKLKTQLGSPGVFNRIAKYIIKN